MSFTVQRTTAVLLRLTVSDASRNPIHPHSGVVFDVDDFTVEHDEQGRKVITANGHEGITISLRFGVAHGPALAKALCAECGVKHCSLVQP